jgi:hypothetical protein
MTLLITVFAAITVTVMWYNGTANGKEMNLGELCLMYWGAAIMWFVDSVVEYAELGAEYFTPSVADMLNDTYLGFSVVAFGLVIWLVRLLLKDSKGIAARLIK